MISFRFIVWLILFVASIIVANIQIRSFPHIFVIFLGLLPVVSFLHAQLQKKKFKVSTRGKMDSVTRGQTAVWRVNIENLDYFSTHFLKVHIPYDEKRVIERYILAPHTVSHFSLKEEGRHCGVLSAPRFRIYYYDVFGLFLFSLNKDFSKALQDIYVLPLEKVESLEYEATDSMLENGNFNAKNIEIQMDEIKQIRGYRSGDNRKFIHQKLSARMQEWMVREYKESQERIIRLLIDLTPLSCKDCSEYMLDQRDRALDQITISAKLLLLQGFQIVFTSYESTPSEVFLKSPQVLGVLKKSLALLPTYLTLNISKQITEEMARANEGIYFIVLLQLNSNIVMDLKRLREKTQDLFVQHINLSNEMVNASLIQELLDYGIRYQQIREEVK